jgi:hypothetical protein
VIETRLLRSFATAIGLSETRGSGVLVLEGGRWKVAQYNLSIPIPNELVREIVRVIRRPR